jgi:hypothetical protein
MALETNAQLSNVAELANLPGIVAFEATTTGTDPEPLPSSEVSNGKEVQVLARVGNSGNVFVGGEGSQVVPIQPGTPYQGLGFNVNNTEDIYIQTPNAGDGVYVIYEGT